MAVIKIIDLPAESIATDDDLIVIRENSSGTTKKITKAEFLSNSPAVTNPTGIMLAYGGSSAPSGWLICNGSTVSRTTYANLFAVIGVAYGGGDGSTTFNLPDKTGRVSIGRSYAGPGAPYINIGSTGGASTHTLSTAEMPIHAHGLNDPGHNHATVGDPVYTSGSGSQRTYTPGGAYAGQQLRWSIGGNYPSGTGIWMNNAGGNVAHNNMQPYQVDTWIIKI